MLPELFGRGEEEVFDQLDEPGDDGGARRGRSAAPVRPVLDAAQLAVTLRRTRASHLARLRDELPAGTPLLYVPVPVPAQPRRPGHPPGRRAPRRGARVTDGRARRRRRPSTGSIEQLLAAKEIVIPCGSGGVGKTTTAAAAAAMAAVHHGGKVLVLTVDPAKRLANALGLEAFGNVETQVPPAAFAAAGVEPRGELWAAMLDTKQSLGRPRAPPRARRRDPRRDPRQPALQEHHRPVRAEPRLHRHGAALRDPRVGHATT